MFAQSTIGSKMAAEFFELSSNTSDYHATKLTLGMTCRFF